MSDYAADYKADYKAACEADYRRLAQLHEVVAANAQRIGTALRQVAVAAEACGGLPALDDALAGLRDELAGLRAEATHLRDALDAWDGRDEPTPARDRAWHLGRVLQPVLSQL